MSYGRYGGGGSRDFNRGFAPKPVEVGKEYEVDVTEVSRQGEVLHESRDTLFSSRMASPDKSLRLKSIK